MYNQCPMSAGMTTMTRHDFKFYLQPLLFISFFLFFIEEFSQGVKFLGNNRTQVLYRVAHNLVKLKK